MISDKQVSILLDDLLAKYGYDFINYSSASLKRRINRLYSLDGFTEFEIFRLKLQTDPVYMKRFVEEVTVNVTEMFRDPWFFKKLRMEILPALSAKKFIRIWHAGCSTGEEVFSMAILLKEASLLEKSLLYATDLNPEVLEIARSGILSINNMKQYSQNYLASGGAEDFSEYYTANYGKVMLAGPLLRKIIFSTHNLVSDRSFNSFDLIVCRNVLIYFNRELQDRVLKLFDESLELSGFLALGTKETIKFSPLENSYMQVGNEKIWKKVR
jgi:chemotaxis protein methyltransferase CheR